MNVRSVEKKVEHSQLDWSAMPEKEDCGAISLKETWLNPSVVKIEWLTASEPDGSSSLTGKSPQPAVLSDHSRRQPIGASVHSVLLAVQDCGWPFKDTCIGSKQNISKHFKRTKKESAKLWGPVMSRRRSRSSSPGRVTRSCSSNYPRDLERRLFIGNLPTSIMEKKDLEELFRPYGKVIDVSMFRGFGFVQFEHIEEAEAAMAAQNGRIYKDYKIDVNMALDRRSAKPHSQPSPPRRPPFGSYGDNKEPRPRSRSPVFPRDARDRDARDTRDRDAREGRDGREGREGREGRDGRDAAREVRPGSHPRDHEYRYRGPEGRDKDLRGPPRDPAYREEYDRFFRGGGGAEDHFRRKDEAFREPFRDPWNGRREPEDGRARPEENRRNELYRQYYEELQRRQETERPVDCSVIVVNKTQNREYAETVGRKVHDLGMVVDLIFLNTEVSLTQALEDVGRARTPFAIIITQQHQVHRSCTVNILFGTPQEHRNMPLQDAMVLITHNYDTYKVESREKEREEMVRKAAKMADDVLLREPDRESHPVAVLTSITLLSENRFLTPEELDGLIAYITDKKARLLRNPADTRTAAVLTASAASSHDAVSAALGLASTLSAHPASQTSLSSQTNSNQELQAKILSLFKNRTGMQADVGAPSSAAAQSQDYSSLGGLVPGHNPLRPGMPATPQAAAQGYSAQMGRSLPPAGGQRASNSAFGINLDNPSVQKALDTLSQGGPTLNHLVGAGGVTQQQQQQLQQHHPQQPFSASRPAANMGQGPPMSMYPRHY
ncbi:nuclear receptor coactivator 5 isoform X4 [Nerophis ophidion]|uniref:nuclear receptor coactivator 5 isoform X4 n=1 Tax=Nerophis ophidion TaxID=159077 RepID=UPI002ADFE8E7|nr:nuclear receptor coactivator 5 isoform X4 [Nerophis ophidion]